MARPRGRAATTTTDGHEVAEAQSWIVQVKRSYESGGYKKRETSSRVSIYRVPGSIKNENENFYDPLIVSLGTYHKKEDLTAMDEHKLQAVQSTLERLRSMTMISELINEVSKLEKDIRDCYEDSAIEWDTDTLVWMLTMDACFILQFLRKDLPRLKSSLILNSIVKDEIEMDILKLENQIPLIILEKILELEIEDSEAVPMFLAKKLIEYRYFRGYPFSQIEEDKGSVQLGRLISEKRPRHLLDLCRVVIADFLRDSGSPSAGKDYIYCTDSAADSGTAECCACTAKCGASFCTTHPKAIICFTPSPTVDKDTIPSAEKLQRAGITFKPSRNGKVDFKYRSFGRSTLLIPQITVDSSTEIFLRNLMAFEECQKGRLHPITTIISMHLGLMDELIDSKEDVGALEKEEIIINYSGNDDDVAKMFSSMCGGISYEDTEFKQVVKMVNEHYNSQLNVWMSQFIEERCSKPWYIVSLLVAALLLGMTAVQTVYSIKK